jgi:hypothetical protein
LVKFHLLLKVQSRFLCFGFWPPGGKVENRITPNIECNLPLPHSNMPPRNEINRNSCSQVIVKCGHRPSAALPLLPNYEPVFLNLKTWLKIGFLESVSLNLIGVPQSSARRLGSVRKFSQPRSFMLYAKATFAHLNLWSWRKY